MSHQDKDDLRTPLAELKERLRPILECDFETIKRHGNSTLNLMGVAITALLTFGWNQQQTLDRRFDDAYEATKRGFSSIWVAGSYQALMVALRACGDALCQAISARLLEHLRSTPGWLLFGRPTFAVDGSQFAVPRTAKNLAAFAAAGRKCKAAYKNQADYAKAKTTQIAVSLCQHLSSGFPAFWNLGGSSDSERGLLLDMLDRLPKDSRLVMDAYYFGFKFWNRLIDSGFTFVVRAGKNIDLLGQLRLEGKVKCRGDLVFYWPQSAIDAGSDPIILSLVTVMVGRKRMFLLTNELTLTESQLAELYAKRWGIEVFFRTVKQSYERAKLLSRTPDNAKQEIQWTMLGMWMALTEGCKHIPEDRRISPVKVLRALCDLVTNVARRSANKLNLAQQLSGCVIADESGRQSDKNSKDYPRKKRKRQTGEPISDDLRKLAMERIV
ncbi:Transposase DDE domain protein [Stieleria maiorica]|uniref:Transposase DDE domain protein n=1 Tax=Stieleria maiorica TaxID=2795974 RepID=A0A5B9MHL6_9BACT|nr:IS4 family transposase [Stieleria maiorica]QEF99999.1 Transposase DDE domain protein [Stieleria maiorica]